MKIGLISDTHGDLEAWNKAIKIFLNEKADVIMHAGDVLCHGVSNPIKKSYDPLDLSDAINNTSIPLVISKGNCDSDVDTVAIEWPIQSPYAFYSTENKKFLVIHGDNHSNEDLKKLGEKFNIDFIIRGHTHENEIISGKTTIINPGSVSLPKNKNNTPTIGIIDDNSIKIIDLNTSKTIDSVKII